MSLISLAFFCAFFGLLAADELLAPPLTGFTKNPPISPDALARVNRSFSGCEDIFVTAKCKSYKKAGLCHYRTFQEKCAKTCENCINNIQEARPTDICQDKYRFCEGHHCSNEKQANLYCKKTCGLCDQYEGPCGIPAVPLHYIFRQKIVGGNNVRYGSIPWQGGIYSREVYDIICGAVLIDQQFLVTAAHCFKRSTEGSEYLIFLGKHHRFIQDRGEKRMTIKKIIIHPHYQRSRANNDIALIQLEHKVTYNTYIRPVCLPNKRTRLYSGRLGLVSGWGWTNVTTKQTDAVLQQVDVEGISSCQCSKWLKKHTGNQVNLTSNMICAGHARGTKDSCRGDSGGPLVVQSGNQHFLAGIVSWGLGCGETERPGIYVKVENYVEWILDNLLL